MISKNIKVVNEEGLYARSAAIFATEAEKYSSEIFISKGNENIRAKDIINILSIKVKKDDEIVITAVGTDEEEAVNELSKLV